MMISLVVGMERRGQDGIVGLILGSWRGTRGIPMRLALLRIRWGNVALRD
jgi:hypothetical protein